MLRNRLISAAIFLWMSLGVSAQFGNEWIDYNQTYFKLKVVEDGFYRVTAAELEAQGFSAASVPANRIQLFRRGQEVAIQVNSSSGVLNYLEFYGLKNSGAGDTELYIEPSAQPHDLYNLFTDTAAYFLTWKLTAESGSRMGLSTLNDATGLSAETHHLAEDLSLGISSYAPGIKFGSGSSFSLSEYDFGEGWTGNFVSKGSAKTFNLTLDKYESSGADPQIEVVIVGGNTLSHNVDIEVGPNTSNLRNIGNVQFSNRSSAKATFSFLDSDVGASGELVVRVKTTGFAGASDRVSTAMVRVAYPQSVSMIANENKIFFLRELPAEDKAYLRIATPNAPGTEVYDVTNEKSPIRIVSTSFSDRLECIIPGTEAKRKVIAVTSPLSVVDVQPIAFEQVDIDSDYLIITHAALHQNASDGLDPIQSFTEYRASVAGGEYSSETLNFFDVVNQFNYGDVSPIAIRRLVDFAITNGSPQALFLIGKGRTPDRNFFRNSDHSVVNVPTYGDPGGDLMFSRGLGADPILPILAVGRLNAFNSENVKAYVDKLKEMEAVPFDDLFRKNVLQLSGGQTAFELATFRRYIEDFQAVLEGDFLGGKAINVGKETTNSVEVIDAVAEVNAGVGLITFFGHSSGTVTDIEIGRVSDGKFGYANQGKYPVILINGCNAGDVFGTNFTFGEDWMITPNLGAIAFVAHADFASSSALKRYSDIFYDVVFAEEDWFGVALGDIILESSKRYLTNFGTSGLAQTQALQVILQGDPMVRVFGANQPDYEITGERVWAESYTGGSLLAAQDSFMVNMIVRNYGRTVSDSLIVQIDRTLPEGMFTSSFRKLLSPLREDTIRFNLNNEFGQEVVGSNGLLITLDPSDEIAELNEGNNQTATSIEIFQGNTAHLYPPDFSIYATSDISFFWQPTDILEPNRSYEMQLDTVVTFDSPYFRSFTETGVQLLNQDLDFSTDNLPDTTTLFWRTRFANPIDTQEEEWEQTSFTLILGGDVGWGQFVPDQVGQDNLIGVDQTGTDELQFITTDSPLDIFTFGATHPTFTYSDLTIMAGGIDYLVTSNTIDPVCSNNTLNALVFDRESTNPYRPIQINGADVFNRLVCGRLPQMIYNLRETDVLGSSAYLERLIENMAIGDHILLFNIGQVNYSNWDSDVLDALELVGVSSTDMAGLTDGQPLILLGRKGDTAGLANIISTDGTANPVTEHAVQMTDNVIGSFTNGSVTSGRIGPAKNWLGFRYQTRENVEDVFDVTLLGITPEGNEVDLFSFARTAYQDLTSVDATEYPWMKLKFSFMDDTNLTPPQLDFWQVTYEEPPEGILLADAEETKIISEGQPAVKQLSFYNLSSVNFADSLDVNVKLVSTNNGNLSEQVLKIEGPLAGDTTSFSTEVGTIGQGGLNNLAVLAIASENELNTFNNQLTLPNAVNVQADNANPILDVTFDGSYIMNGDIVSPEPTVLIRMRDDNPFLIKSDTIGIELEFGQLCEGCVFARVNFTDPKVTYSPATESSDFEITYAPGPLGDGLYTLRVQGKDESGNSAGEEPYEVEFEVITSSSITHFYPYPNPFSTQTRFVFTLTGSTIPEKIKIQIMTISGRIVREINQGEIGPIKIGNNITAFAWDGTDEYGDQLANGVYFYRVLMESEAGQFKQRSTSADGAFKNGFGKLYILR